jgi:hypothetical protein
MALSVRVIHCLCLAVIFLSLSHLTVAEDSDEIRFSEKYSSVAAPVGVEFYFCLICMYQ